MRDKSDNRAARGEIRLALRDGAEVVVRVVQPSDKETIASAFKRLSEQSRYQRFLTVREELSSGELRYLTEIDHHDHDALIALDASTGEGVAVARFIRSRTDVGAAEAAVVVADAWQRRGLGRALTALIADRARSEGVERFKAMLLATNHGMLALLRSLGPVRVVHSEGPIVEVEMDLPLEGISEHIEGVLRAAAGGAEIVTDTHEMPAQGS
jgi:GNAT superfamily N-acetyltransferase